jgi:hypothetical protein
LSAFFSHCDVLRYRARDSRAVDADRSADDQTEVVTIVDDGDVVGRVRAADLLERSCPWMG